MSARGWLQGWAARTAQAFARGPAGRDAPVAPAQALLHPLWIASLLTLAVNDHLLKRADLLPPWLTGKLSDLAGLVVAPALFALLIRARSRGLLLLAHVAVGAVFAALDLSPALTALWRVPFAALGVGWQSAHDPTDLLALPMLLVSWWLSARPPVAAPLRAAPPLAERALVVFGMVACMATSKEAEPSDSPPIVPNPPNQPCTDCDGDGWPQSLDCDDSDPSVNPGAENCPDPVIEESCDDGLDDDHDGLVDCADPDCSAACAAVTAACGVAPQVLDTIAGTTLGVTGTMKGSCVGADAPEAVFMFKPSAPAGILTLDLPPGHGMYLRTGCFDPSSEIACFAPGAGAGGPLQLTVGPEVLYLVVDAGSAFDAADFSVPLSYQPLVCGDGLVVGSEECDDGNVVPGDGCSALCTSELPAVCQTLAPLVLGLNPGDTTGAPLLPGGSCAGGNAVPDRRFGFVPPSDGTLHLDLTSTGNLAMHVRTSCADPASEIACADAAQAGGSEVLDVPVTTGVAISIFVDASSSPADAAPFLLQASLLP